MREIDLENLTSQDFIDYGAIAAKFKDYLMLVLGYEEYEADFIISSDFENPYDTPFIMQDYEGTFTVDGKNYEVRLCRTDFRLVGLFHLVDVPPFEFYMFIDLDTLPNKSVGAYQNARKAYLF